MKKVLFWSMLLAMTAGCASGSAGDRDEDKKVVEVSRNYTELEISNVINAVYLDTAKCLYVSCQKEVMPYVVVNDKGGKLEVYLDSRPLDKKLFNRLVVDVVIPSSSSLQSVDVSGASRFYSEQPLGKTIADVEVSGASAFEADINAGGNLSVEVSGACKLVSAVNAPDLDVDVSGASKMELDGNVDALSLSVSGASSVEMNEDMKAGVVRVDISGASKAVVKADKKLTGNVSGASKMVYSGDADVNVESNFSSVSKR